jgi:hypothetical protein
VIGSNGNLHAVCLPQSSIWRISVLGRSSDATRQRLSGAGRVRESKEGFNGMQLACSSAMLDHLLVSGDVTQLEWVDLAARSLPVDGLVFEMRHFPRTDHEYLAELRKLCVDRSLTIAAIAIDNIFAYDTEALEAIFEVAVMLGAPLILTDPPQANAEVPAYAWREAAQHGKLAARIAKRANVTIAVRNAPHSLCPGAAELKRLTKDIDSSWLRFAPDASSLSAEDLSTLRARSVIVTVRDLTVPTLEADRKGFVVLEAREPKLDAVALIATVRAYAAKFRRLQEAEALPR